MGLFFFLITWSIVQLPPICIEIAMIYSILELQYNQLDEIEIWKKHPHLTGTTFNEQSLVKKDNLSKTTTNTMCYNVALVVGSRGNYYTLQNNMAIIETDH